MADRNDDLTRKGVKNSAEGKTDHAKGHIKDGVGGLTGDKSMQTEGKIDQVKGSVKDKFGEVQRDLGRDEKAR